MTFSLVVLVGAFILIPGGGGLVFSLCGTHLVAISLAFSSLGAGFLVTTSKEVALGTLKFGFRAIFSDMPFLLTVETFILATCLYGIYVHGVRVFLLDPFCRSFLYETKELFASSHLPKIGLECI